MKPPKLGETQLTSDPSTTRYHFCFKCNSVLGTTPSSIFSVSSFSSFSCSPVKINCFGVSTKKCSCHTYNIDNAGSKRAWLITMGVANFVNRVLQEQLTVLNGIGQVHQLKIDRIYGTWVRLTINILSLKLTFRISDNWH